MQSKKRLTLLGAVIATALGAPLAADALPLPTGTIVAVQLKQPTTPVLGGVYTSPYPALIGPGSDTTSAQLATNSVLSPIICDDFLTDVSAGTFWHATITDMSALSGGLQSQLKFDTGNAAQQLDDYKTVAQLAQELGAVNPASKTAQLLSYAIWDVFDPASLLKLNASPPASCPPSDHSDYCLALDDVAAARAIAGTKNLGAYSNVEILTPIDSGPKGKNASQEYVMLTVPEPSLLSLLGIAGAAFAARRRKRC